MKTIYLDHAATTPINEDVLQAMFPYLTENYGNASSLYTIGRKSRKAVEESREKIANIIGADKDEIYFTSCGSESDNLAIKGVAYANKGKHIITSKIEHPAVLITCKKLEKKGYDVSYINVDENGVIKLDELKKEIRKDTILITVMYANNEIGTYQPIKEIGQIAKERGIIFHTDAVQVTGNTKINVKELNIDLLSMSAHKFYGPKGMGALYVKNTVDFERVQDGGHQERNKRAGTENVAGIVGMATALELSHKNLDEKNKYVEELRDYYINSVREKIPNIKINGIPKYGLAGVANISFEGVSRRRCIIKFRLNWNLCI